VYELPRRRRFKAGWALAAALALAIGGIVFVVNESWHISERGRDWEKIAASKQSLSTPAPHHELTASATGSNVLLATGDTLKDRPQSAAMSGGVATMPSLSVQPTESLATGIAAPSPPSVNITPAMPGSVTSLSKASLDSRPATDALASGTGMRIAEGPATNEPAVAPATPPVTASPGEMTASSDAMAVGSAAQALAQLSGVRSSDQPVILTLAARNNEDLLRLQQRLAEFAPSLSKATVAGGAPQNQLNASNSQLYRQQANYDNRAFDNRRNVAANADANEAAAPDAGNGAGTRARFSNSAEDNQSLAQNGNAQQTPTTYRVNLRPDQLQQLVQEFRVTAVTQGHRQFVVDASKAYSKEMPPLDAAARDQDAAAAVTPVPASQPEAVAIAPPVARSAAIGGARGGRGGRGGGAGGGMGGAAAGGAGGFGGTGFGGGGGGRRSASSNLATGEQDFVRDAGNREGSAQTQKANASAPLSSPLRTEPLPAPAAAAPATIDCLIQITPPSPAVQP
jgi:hypothetical protein